MNTTERKHMLNVLSELLALPANYLVWGTSSIPPVQQKQTIVQVVSTTSLATPTLSFLWCALDRKQWHKQLTPRPTFAGKDTHEGSINPQRLFGFRLFVQAGVPLARAQQAPTEAYHASQPLTPPKDQVVLPTQHRQCNGSPSISKGTDPCPGRVARHNCDG